MSKTRISQGDVFAVPLPDGTYVMGRVMLDIYATTKKRLFRADSPLPGLGKALLIEMYAHLSRSQEYHASELLVPGAFVEPSEVGLAWEIVANIPVDFQDVRFPETMIGHMHERGEVAFECGEMRLPLPFTLQDLDAMGVLSTRHSAFLWPYNCLYALDRETEIPAEYRASCHLADSDLRFSEHRSRVYKYLPIDPNESYNQQQRKLGLNIERLYE